MASLTGDASLFCSKTVLFMLFNFCSSCGIIFVNKILFQTYDFPFATFTTSCHFVVTFMGVIICKHLGMFQVKTLSNYDVLSITIFFVGFVVFNNLSLNYNSIGFYQLMKVMTTPVIAFIQHFFYNVRLPFKLQLSLIPIIVGVAMSTVSDVRFNRYGLFWAVLGIISTSYYQIFVKKKQKDLEANALQILYYQAPQAAAMTFVLTPFLDEQLELQELTSLLASGLTPGQVAVSGVLFLSCILAFCVNLSIFLVVGATSPISYNVLGHAKLLVILTFGIMAFGDDTNSTRLCGMLMAFGGIVAYTHLKIKEQEAKDKEITLAEHDETDEPLLVEIVNKGH